MTSITVEPATLDRVGDIVDLMESAYRGDVSRKGWTSEADLIDGARTSVAEISASITDPKTYTLVAKNDGDTIIGCASITFDGPSCIFGKFAVSPDQQAAGIGKLLLAAAENTAITHFGVSTMTMTVIEGRTELEAFYERRGYVRTGNIVYMADIHTGDDMTIGHDLVLNEFAKSLTSAL
jgi:GNAT superfamily N-acetyltransferase